MFATLTWLAPAGCGGAGESADGGPATDANEIADGAGALDARSGVATDGGSDADLVALDAGTLQSCAPNRLPIGTSSLAVDHDGLPRRYLVHVPSVIDEGRPLPVVVDFHGNASNPEEQDGYSSFAALGEAHGFIAVHPEGTGLVRSWNAGVCCGEAQRNAIDDVGFARDLVADLAARTCIDANRIYATGLSNGGFLSYRLACEAADLFAAIGPVAGGLGIPPEQCIPVRPVPIVHVHGTADLIVPVGGNPLLGFAPLDETIGGWIDRNGCERTASETTTSGDTRCTTYRGCEEDADVMLCTVEGGGHLWPGGTATSELVWAFLAQHQMRP